MASTSLASHVECNHIDPAGQGCPANDLGDEPTSPRSEHIQDIPHALLTTPVQEAGSRLQFLLTWLLGYFRYICSVLGYLTAYLPSTQMDHHHEECNLSSIDMDEERGVLPVDSSNADNSEHRLEPKHKVFLSHSGAQKDFVEQLCVDLERCDRYPFFDKRQSSLPLGEEFPKLIFDAIEQCRVGVVVLSEEFFMRSKWPMLELTAMVKEFEKPNPRIRIIPVFYLISVEALKDLKNQRRWTSQWEKWAVNDKRINVEEWKRVLKVIGAINSLVLKEGYGDVKLREEIVAKVCQLVPCETRWDDSHVQGRSRSCKVIQDKMDQVSLKSRVPIVGLYGVGGIGKTTICKALCNDLSPKFGDNVCHVELGSGSEMELLRKALKKVTNLRLDILDSLDDIDKGYGFLKKKLCSGPIFFVVDNVHDDYKSLEVAQTYLKAGYGCGSVILITARSLDVLKKLNLEEGDCLEMPEVDEDEARSLFLNSANLPPGNQIDEVLVKDCIERCHFLKGDGKSRHYHPLALKVLGQQLGCNTTRWAVELRKIKRLKELGVKEHPVFSILRSSFDSLTHKHQLVFMDVALMVTHEFNTLELAWKRRDWLCMVHEESVEDMLDMLDVLKSKSLLEDLSEDFSEIGIHDLWVDFAVAETKAQDSRARRWMYQVDGRSAAVGRRGGWRESVERMCFLNEGWRGLNGLKLDDFVNVESFKLDVQIHVANATLDLDLSGLKKLKSLYLETTGITVRAEGLSSLTNLAFLMWFTPGFSPCLDEIGRFTNLQLLELWHCKGLKVLDLTELRVLRVLLIRQCPDLITLRGLSSRLANLQALWILRCKSMRECPGLGELYALKILRVRERKLEELPYLGRLINLRKLMIVGCKSLRAVPGLSDLIALETLDTAGCSKLSVLPDLVKLTRLQELDIRGCPVQGVAGMYGLIALTILRASFGKLSGWQPVFPELSVLKVVRIHGWNGPIWKSLRNLLALEVLRLTDCNGEDVDVPNLLNLKSLEFVLLRRCNFKDLSGLSNSTTLESLFVYDCDKLERLPELEKLAKLTDLGIIGCKNLRHWPSSSNLCLSFLLVDEFSLMRIVPDLETLAGLRELRLWGPGCENALRMASSPRLEALCISWSATTAALDVSNFPQLIVLRLEHCSALNRLACSLPLTALTKLRIVDCKSLVEMPDLSTFPRLEKLILKNCGVLRRLTCSRSLTALKKIKVIGLDRQIEMPDLNRFPNLKEFYVEDHFSKYDVTCDLQGEDSAEHLG